MDIAVKYRLLEKLIQLNDDVILDQVKAILGESNNDFWDELDSRTKTSIERGKTQSKNGETRPHETVMNEMKAKFLK